MNLCLWYIHPQRFVTHTPLLLLLPPPPENHPSIHPSTYLVFLANERPHLVEMHGRVLLLRTDRGKRLFDGLAGHGVTHYEQLCSVQGVVADEGTEKNLPAKDLSGWVGGWMKSDG